MGLNPNEGSEVFDWWHGGGADGSGTRRSMQGRGRRDQKGREGKGNCERGNENYYSISVDYGVLIYYQISPIRLGGA